MRKIYLFLAFCLMSVMPVRAEKDYVAIISPYPDETVLTLYYVDNPQEFCQGVNEWHWIGEDFTWFFNGTGQLSQYGDPFRVKKIIIDKSVKDARPTEMGWFIYFDDLRTIVGMENINTSEVTDMASAFAYTFLDVIDISTWDFSKVTDVSRMFYDCYARTIYCNVDMSAMPGITNSEGMFGGDARYVRLKGENGTAWDANHIDKSYARPDKPGQPGYFSRKPTTAQALPYAKYDPLTRVLTYYYDGNYYRNDPYITILEEDYQKKFLDYASDIQKIVIDPSVLNGRPISIAGWFSTCKPSVPLSSLTKIEGLEYIDGTRLKNVSNLFDGCTALEYIDFELFNLPVVTDMSGMFYNCHSLKAVDLYGVSVYNVTTVSGMFTGCSSLERIWCPTDWTIYGMDADDLFDGCTSLVGGKGTRYDPNHTYLDYARPDGGIDAPGYFWVEGDTGQDIDQISQEPKANSQKLIRDGMLLIERNGKTYNAQGAEIK